MLQTYCTIAKTALSQLNNYQVQALLGENDFDMASFRKEKTIIYLMIPSAEQDYWQFIIDMFYTRFFSYLMKDLPTKEDKPVFCLLEEFWSSYINNFQTIVNNIRKYNVSISIILQSIAQISEKYKDSAASVRGWIGSYLILSGADYKTAKEFSETLWNELMIGRNKQTAEADRYQKIELCRPEEITRLDDNHAIFISKNAHPQMIKFTPYYNNQWFKGVLKWKFNLPLRKSKAIAFVNVGKLNKDFEDITAKRELIKREKDTLELEK